VLASYVLASVSGGDGQGSKGDGKRMVLLVVIVGNVGLSSLGGSWVVVQFLRMHDPIEQST
jgi:hypothetical protein